MTDSLPASLSGFIDEVDSSDRTLLLLNRTGPAPLADMLERAFEDQPVTVADRPLPDGADDLVCLVDGGEVVATTPLSALEESFLLVNADRYRTGTRQTESGSFPDVLTGLDEVEFSVRGFPASTKEKLLLVVVSRFVEHRALERGAGELHSTFQRLSRLDDEYGTRTIYEWLAEADVSTHVYGVRDDPDAVTDLDVTVHPSATPWVVVFTPPPGEAGHVALVAVETGPNVWRGMWTYDADRVARIRSYVTRQF